MSDRIHPVARGVLPTLVTGLGFVGVAALDHNRLVDDLAPALAMAILGTAAGALLYPRAKPPRHAWLPVCIVIAFAAIAALCAYAAGVCSARYPGRCDFNGLMALPMGLLLAGFVSRGLSLIEDIEAWGATARAAKTS